MLSIGQYLALSAKAPRPNGGKAFIDFFLGDESMRILAKMGEFVNRKGIHPPLADADKIQACRSGRFRRQGLRGENSRVSEIVLKIAEGDSWPSANFSPPMSASANAPSHPRSK